MLKTAVTYLAAAALVAIGITHFTSPAGFVAIVPDVLPYKLALVYLSGAAEIAGGLGLLWSRTRRAASIGLILLFIAVFPANVNMAVNHLPLGDRELSPVILWARLPFQLVFIAIAWWIGRPNRAA